MWFVFHKAKIQKIFIIDKVFIDMIGITPKEKMLVNILVKLYSKEQLEEELNDILETVDSSKLVRGAAKLIGINANEISRIGLQYLNYAVDNYEKIKNKEYPEDIERVQQVYFYADETEEVIMFSTKRVSINTLPKYDTEYINNYTKQNIQKYFYSFHGGSIVNKKDFQDILNNNSVLDLVTTTNLGEYCHQNIHYENKIVADDMLLSSLVYLNNKTIGPYKGHFEFYSQKIDLRDPNVEVVHQYRVW